jgi:hypothetical protein
MGIGGALAAARLIASLLFGVSASDPLTFAAVAILMTLVALAACWIPARRAMRVDPIEALRYEFQTNTRATAATYCGGFFFLKRPPRLLMASAGALPTSFPAPEPRPAAQPSCDLSMPAASPPTSGMNFGSVVVP